LRTPDAPLNLSSDNQVLHGLANTKAFAKCHYQVNLFSRLFVMSCLLEATRLPEGGEPSIANPSANPSRRSIIVLTSVMRFARVQSILRAAIQPGIRHGSLIKFCPEP
jgi:hypothetical protein